MFVSQIAGLTQQDMFNMAEGTVGCPPSIPASLAVPAHLQLHHLVSRLDPKAPAVPVRVTAYDPGFALGNARVLIGLHAAVQQGKDHEDGGRVAQVRAVGVRAGRARAWNAPP